MTAFVVYLIEAVLIITSMVFLIIATSKHNTGYTKSGAKTFTIIGLTAIASLIAFMLIFDRNSFIFLKVLIIFLIPIIMLCIDKFAEYATFTIGLLYIGLLLFVFIICGSIYSANVKVEKEPTVCETLSYNYYDKIDIKDDEQINVFWYEVQDTKVRIITRDKNGHLKDEDISKAICDFRIKVGNSPKMKIIEKVFYTRNYNNCPNENNIVGGNDRAVKTITYVIYDLPATS